MISHGNRWKCFTCVIFTQFTAQFGHLPISTHQPVFPYHTQLPIRKREGFTCFLQEGCEKSHSHLCTLLLITGKRNTGSKGPSVFFCMHGLRDPSNWLVSLWLTREREKAIPPTRRLWLILLPWLLAMDGCIITFQLHHLVDLWIFLFSLSQK